MKRLLILAISMMIAGTAMAGTASSGKSERLWDAQTIAGTGATVVSRSFPVANIKDMGVWWKLNQAVEATPSHTSSSNVGLYIEMSYDDTAANYSTVSTIGTRAVNTVSTVDTVSFKPMKYARFRATGLTGQGTDSTITAYLFTQE